MDIISYALGKKGMQQSVSDYLDEHLTNPTNPPIDTSLTIAGAAADSKATGDKLSALKEDFVQSADYATSGTFVVPSDYIEQGAFLATGEPTVSPTRIRTKYPIRVSAGSTFAFTKGSVCKAIYWFFFKDSGTLETSGEWITANLHKEFSESGYLKFAVRAKDQHRITPTDYDATATFESTMHNALEKMENALEETENAIYSSETVTWEQGTYNAQGVSSSSTTRIRTPSTVSYRDGYVSMQTNNGYKFAVQAFDDNNVFLGLLQNDDTFAKTASNMAILTSVSFIKYNAWKNYSFRFIGTAPNGTDAIVPSEGSNYIFKVLKVARVSSNRQINVRDYGATGNGVSDDSVAIQEALNVGGEIYIPDGTYLIKTSLVIHSNTKLVLSPKATLLRGANIRCLIHSYCEVDTTGYDGVHDVTIDGGTLDLGTGFTQGASNVAFIHGENIAIRNCTMLHMSKGYHFCDIAGCKNVLIENCIFKDALSEQNTACFIQVDCPWGQITYTYDEFADGSACFDSTPCMQYVVRGCTFYLNEYSPAFGNHNDGLNKYIVFENNYVYGGTSARGAIAFADYKEHNYTDLIYVHDNIFSNCSYGFKFMNDGTGRAYIKNNIFENIGQLQVNPNSPVGHFDNNIEVSTA